ncbi:MAG: glycosyltransferase family 39 protein [Chloroflexi bacterium]|nr:glycosyltransferase family 39 protein [Chloroflexota bacterium]
MRVRAIPQRGPTGETGIVRDEEGRSRRIVAIAAYVVASLAVVVYLGLVVAQLNRPLMYDDANFALGARAVAETGLPYGNQGWMSDRGDFSHREQWALWHPPLYIYAEGLLARLGGWTAPVLRLLGVVGGVATALLTFLLARDLTRGPLLVRDVAGATAVALVVLCPLIVQSTLILDIDFPILLPLSLLFLWLYPRLENSQKQWLWLGPLFAVMLWAKMTNPVPLLAVIGVWQVLRGRWLRGALHVLVIGGVGIALAGVVWLGIGTLQGFPLDMPFGVNLVQWQDSADVARRAYTSPGAFIEGLQPTAIWLGPGLVALGLLGVAVRVAGLVRCWQMRHADLLIGFAVVLVLGYVNKSAGWFPKYQVALAPLLACMAAPVIAHLWCVRPRLVTACGVAAALVSLAITLALVRDDWALERTWAIQPLAGACFVGLVVVVALVGATRRAPGAAAAFAVTGLALGWSVAIDAVQVHADYQTDYWYGTTGTDAAAAWVDAHLQPGQTYLSAKEVAIRSQDQRYVDQDNLVYALSTGRPFEATWMGEPLQALVTWQREPYLRDLFARAVAGSNFREVARYGDYVIYAPESAS